jgi:uncharacterized protein (DUF697 family)
MTTEIIELIPVGKRHAADRIIRQNIYWAMGACVFHVPWIELSGIAIFQIKMLKELCALYGMRFSEQRAKIVLSSLFATGSACTVGHGFLKRVVKAIPVIGHVGGVITLASMAAAFTYALGQVFVHHFEKGGTYLNFDPETSQEDFARLMNEWRRSVPTDMSSTGG